MRKLVCILISFYILVLPSYAYWFSEGECVYVTPSGGCYHQDVCGYVGEEWTELQYEYAVAMGYSACSWCGEEDTSEWEPYGDWLWYNPYVEQWRDEDGYLYGNPSEAYEAHGYTYHADGDLWIGDYGYLVDGEYHAYPEDVPDYCNDCENIIEDRYNDHDEDCVNNPNMKEVQEAAETKEESQDNFLAVIFWIFVLIAGMCAVFSFLGRLGRKKNAQ